MKKSKAKYILFVISIVIFISSFLGFIKGTKYNYKKFYASPEIAVSNFLKPNKAKKIALLKSRGSYLEAVLQYDKIKIFDFKIKSDSNGKKYSVNNYQVFKIDFENVSEEFPKSEEWLSYRALYKNDKAEQIPFCVIKKGDSKFDSSYSKVEFEYLDEKYYFIYQS